MTANLSLLDRFGAKHKPTGSRVICNPPPADTDEDHVVFIENWLMCEALEALENYGYHVPDPEERYNNTEMPNFVSVRKDDVNLIVTGKKHFYNRFVAATSLARRFNLLNKEDRIALFQAVLYGASCDDNHEPLDGLDAAGA